MSDGGLARQLPESGRQIRNEVMLSVIAGVLLMRRVIATRALNEADPDQLVTRSRGGVRGDHRNADGMMARMPELSRRAMLRLGVGAAAGAAGAFALGSALHTQGRPSPGRRCR